MATTVKRSVGTRNILDIGTIAVDSTGLVLTLTPITFSSISWTRSGTVATLAITGHGLRANNVIRVSVSSSAAAIPLASYSVASVPDLDSITITCLNAGLTSGTLTALAEIDTNWGSGDTVRLRSGAAFDEAFDEAFDSYVDGYITSRDSATQVTIQEALPTDVRSTSGNLFSFMRSFATASSWEAACPVDLVAEDKVWKGECYNDSVFTDGVSIAGPTVDSTRYIWLTHASGHRHTGKSGTGVRFNMAGGTKNITTSCEYTVIEGLCIYDIEGAYNCYVIGSSISNLTVDGCLMYGTSHGSQQAISVQGGNYLIKNNIWYSQSTCWYFCQMPNWSGGTVYNNSIYAPVDAWGILDQGASGATVYNNLVYVAGTAFGAFTSGTCNYNISNDASALGANSQRNVSLANFGFISTTASSEDMRLLSISYAIGTGVALTDMQDITGALRRASAWDVGAHQLTILSTVGTTARTFSTMTSWETACQADISVATGTAHIWRGECYADTVFNEKLTITGTTTDSTHYAYLTAATGQRHAGKVVSGVVALNDSTTSPQASVTISQNYTVFEWICVGNRAASNGGSLFNVGGGPTGAVTIRNCIFYDLTNSGGGENNAVGLSGTCYFYDNIIYNVRSTGIFVANSGFYYIYNCTIFGVGRQVASSSSGIANQGGNGQIHLRNTVIIMNDPSYYSISDTCASSTYDYNIYSSIPSVVVSYGANSLINKTTADLAFVSPTGTKDYRLTSASIAIGIGTNLGATYINDVTGVSRYSSLWDIGAHQLVITSNVGGNGAPTRDFTTITSWEAACPSDISVATGSCHVWKGECYKESAFVEGFSVASTTVDSTHYLWLIPATGQEHTGKQGTGVTVDFNKVLSRRISIQCAYTRIEFLEIKNGNLNAQSFVGVAGVTGCLINGCLVHGYETSSSQAMYALSTSFGTITISNNISYDIPTQFISMPSALGGLLYNNTVYYTKAGAKGILNAGTSTATIKNNIVITPGEAIATFASGTLDYNIVSDATVVGANSHAGKTISDIAPISSTAGSEDLRLLSTSIAVGAADSTIPITTDVTRVIRGSLFDVGAHQLIVLSTIGTTARTFSIITSWEAACPADISSVTGTAHVWKGECYKDSVFDETVVISGTTVDSTHYIWLSVASSQRHTGIAGTGVVLQRSGVLGVSTSHVSISVNYTIVEWLETIYGSVTSGSYNTHINITGGFGSIIRNCICHGTHANQYQPSSMIGAGTSYQVNYILNNFVYDVIDRGGPIAGIRDNVSNQGYSIIENNTVYNVTGIASIGIIQIGIGTIRNNIVLSAVTCFSVSGGTYSNNMSSDATAPGVDSIINQSAADTFVSIV